MAELDPLARWRSAYSQHRLAMQQHRCCAPHRRPSYYGVLVQPPQCDCHSLRGSSGPRERKLTARCADWYRQPVSLVWSMTALFPLRLILVYKSALLACPIPSLKHALITRLTSWSVTLYAPRSILSE